MGSAVYECSANQDGDQTRCKNGVDGRLLRQVGFWETSRFHDDAQVETLRRETRYGFQQPPAWWQLAFKAGWRPLRGRRFSTYDTTAAGLAAEGHYVGAGLSDAPAASVFPCRRFC